MKLIVEYDGTNYHGWQRQKNAITIQETLEDALKVLLKKDISILGAGRTDSGAHARGQTANFRVDELRISPDRLPFALNNILPKDIQVKHAEQVPVDFHSSLWAKKKIYSYHIFNNRVSSPLLRNYSYHFPKALDIEKMRKAGGYLIGKQDFASFASAGSNVRTTVRQIMSFDIKRNGKLISATFKGDGFLYNMVRIMMVTLLIVGEGKVAPEHILYVIKSRKRELAGVTLPSKGLILEEVIY